MKINTITCHDVYNYGASLQAYALQFYLENQGYEYQIIDYKPWYLSQKYQFTKINRSNKRYGIYSNLGVFKPLFALLLNRKHLKFWKRKQRFDLFKANYLHCTPNIYHTNEELASLPPVDVYITGSDQVWNTDLQNGRDRAFYLEFAPNDAIKISYAASFGISKVNDEYVELVKHGLKRLNWVSIREITGISIVQSLGIKAEWVMDPVFLLSAAEWLKICDCSHRSCEEYIFLYYLGKKSDALELFVKRLAKEKGLKIYSINDGKHLEFADKNIDNAGPIEFIEYLSNASVVVSTSFHATAFSLIFNKPFYVFPIQGQNNQSRMYDLLLSVGLENRFVESPDKEISDIDFSKADEKMYKYTELSKQKLLQQLIQK